LEKFDPGPCRDLSEKFAIIDKKEGVGYFGALQNRFRAFDPEREAA
jgi:hypothetical protein